MDGVRQKPETDVAMEPSAVRGGGGVQQVKVKERIEQPVQKSVANS